MIMHPIETIKKALRSHKAYTLKASLYQLSFPTLTTSHLSISRGGLFPLLQSHRFLLKHRRLQYFSSSLPTSRSGHHSPPLHQYRPQKQFEKLILAIIYIIGIGSWSLVDDSMSHLPSRGPSLPAPEFQPHNTCSQAWSQSSQICFPKDRIRWRRVRCQGFQISCCASTHSSRKI